METQNSGLRRIPVEAAEQLIEMSAASKLLSICKIIYPMNRTNVLYAYSTVISGYGSMVPQLQGLLPRCCCFLHEADRIDLLFEIGQSEVLIKVYTAYSGSQSFRDYTTVMALLARL
jgi:hypothetical protein